MRIKKSWLFILLLFLSFSTFHEFFISHHIHSDKSHIDISSSDVDHEACGECHMTHLNFISQNIETKIEVFSVLKPLFSKDHFIILSNKYIPFKPPIS
jgi:hypothetical protein